MTLHQVSHIFQCLNKRRLIITIEVTAGPFQYLFPAIDLTHLFWAVSVHAVNN